MNQPRNALPDGGAALELAGVTVAVPDGPDTLTILDDVSLTVAQGEIVSLVGASGSGKSTLLAVAGLLRTPTAGRIRIAGSDVDGLSPRSITKLRARSIGLIFQTPNLFPSLTALEQVELVAHVAGRLDGRARERARDLLGDVGLGDRMRNRPAELSGGERQRVGIARALMGDPELLLADEPTSALDDERGRAVIELIVTEARRCGAGTIIVTHHPAQLPAASRTLHLAGGHLTEDAAASERTATV